MEMIDLGQKEEGPVAVESAGKSKKQKIRYPSFSMRGEDIPEELKNAKNGDMCRCEIIIRKIGDNLDTYAEGEPRRVEVEVRKLGYIGKAGKMSKEEYLNASDDEREKNDKENMEEEPEEKEEENAE